MALHIEDTPNLVLQIEYLPRYRLLGTDAFSPELLHNLLSQSWRFFSIPDH
jgi:hypothetical protein